ncbi:MAG: NAD(P)/FAD-dependent oxidoreductase [Candidatus Methylomirabilia bacterium]
MSGKPAVAVIGGGVSGLSCALTVAELGCKDVVLIERNSIASGSSGLSAGVFTRQYVTQLDIQLRTNAYEAFAELEREDGLLIARNGFLRLGHDAETVSQFEAGAKRQRELGVHDAVVLSPDEVANLIPDMECSDIVGGMYCPTDGHLDGHQLCMIYARKAEALGVRILQQTPLTGVEVGTRHTHRLLTTAGEIECDVVINAAGSWASEVGELLGARVTVIPQRHQICRGQLMSPPDCSMPFVMDYVVGSGEPGLYFRREGRDQLLAGLHTNEVLQSECEDPDDYKGGVDFEFMELVATKLRTRLPGIGEIGLHNGWAGLYPMSLDGMPMVGPFAEQPTVIAACGLGGVGVNLSPIVGRLAAEWVVYGEPRAIEGAEKLSPNRFSAVAA